MIVCKVNARYRGGREKPEGKDREQTEDETDTRLKSENEGVPLVYRGERDKINEKEVNVIGGVDAGARRRHIVCTGLAEQYENFLCVVVSWPVCAVTGSLRRRKRGR